MGANCQQDQNCLGGSKMCSNKEDNDMSTTVEKLTIANKNVDSVMDVLWTKGEQNLKKLEADFKKNHAKGSKKD